MDKDLRKVILRNIKTHLIKEMEKFKIRTSQYYCTIDLHDINSPMGMTKATFTARNGHVIEINCVEHDELGRVKSHNVPLLIKPEEK